LGQTDHVCVQIESHAGHRDLERVALALQKRRSHLDCAAHDLRQRQPLLLQLNLALGDAGDVEQIVHQVYQMRRLAFDDRLLARGVVTAFRFHQL